MCACLDLFKTFIRPLLGPKCCRFSPTCTAYAHEAFARHGAAKGAMLSAKRLLKCHPFHDGGWDPVP